MHSDLDSIKKVLAIAEMDPEIDALMQIHGDRVTLEDSDP
jgi:hypothetical protein